MSLRSALLYSLSTRHLSLVIQFVATIIIARLLSPEEIGIFSVGAAVVAIAHTLRDFGTSTYVIQEKELTDARLRTALTLTVLVAWSIATLLWLVSTPLSRFYDEPGVNEVLKVMAINFVLIPFGSITMALLKRDMNFRAVMYIGVASTFVQSATSIALAAIGLGFISLAWAAVCGTATTVMGAAIASRKWVLARPSLSERKRVLGFSMRSSLASIASEAGHASPDIVLGRTLGMEATGLFSRAMGYVQLFERLLQDVLRSVMLPYLAGEARAGVDLRKKLNLAMENIGAISWFGIGLTAVLAEPMILLLFGPQWTEAVSVAQILCVAMAIRCFAPTLASALVANDQIALLMRVSLWSTLGKFVLLIGLSPYGLNMAALGFVAAEVVALLMLVNKTHHAKLFTWPDYLGICFKTLPFTLASLAPALIASVYLELPDTHVELAVFLVTSIAVSGLFWLTLLWVLDRPPKHELQRLSKSLWIKLKARYSSRK